MTTAEKIEKKDLNLDGTVLAISLIQVDHCFPIIISSSDLVYYVICTR